MAKSQKKATKKNDQDDVANFIPGIFCLILPSGWLALPHNCYWLLVKPPHVSRRTVRHLFEASRGIFVCFSFGFFFYPNTLQVFPSTPRRQQPRVVLYHLHVSCSTQRKLMHTQNIHKWSRNNNTWRCFFYKQFSSSFLQKEQHFWAFLATNVSLTQCSA